MARNLVGSEQKNKVRNYHEMNRIAKKGQILFTGSSLMEQFPIAEYALSKDLGKCVYNRGIGGTTTDDFLREIDTVLFDLEPSKVFINIGTNDINEQSDGEYWQDHLLKNYEEILRQMKVRLPGTMVYMMAYYPVNPTDQGPDWAKNMFKTRTNEALNDTNSKLRKLAKKYGYSFIDVNDGLKDENGQLRAEITIEGLHMYAGGYESVYDNLLKYLA
ncbi:MAG: lysophospholipase [Firmicutes bacterium]|nr:lysophospholipase [Bacillota bacterium]